MQTQIFFSVFELWTFLHLGRGYLCFMRVSIAMFSTRVFWIVDVWFVTLVGIVLVVFSF